MPHVSAIFDDGLLDPRLHIHCADTTWLVFESLENRKNMVITLLIINWNINRKNMVITLLFESSCIVIVMME